MSPEVVLPSPVVRTLGSGGPLVVLLHGRGASESTMLGLAEVLDAALPGRATYACVRAPLPEGPGYAWFANRGIGRPRAESLREVMDWFRSWLDTEHDGRPVLLVGFSGGAAFAGGLALGDPGRWSGLAVLLGTLPFDAGVPTGAGRLADLPVLVAQGDDDHVIPAELLAATWDYLHDASGAATTGHRDPGGHGLAAGTVRALATWLDDVLAATVPA